MKAESVQTHGQVEQIEQDGYLTVKEIAERLRVSGSTVARLILCEELPGIRVGKRFRVARKDLEAWIKTRGERVREEAEQAAQMFPRRRR